MIRAVLVTIALDILIAACFLSYTAGLVEGVTHRHTSDQTASISR